MFTTKTFAFIAVAVFLFFLASVTSVGWVRILDALLWGMLGLSLLLEWLSVTAVDVVRRIVGIEHDGAPPGPVEDDVVEVELELRNRWFWPRFFVSATYEAPMESEPSRWQRFFAANLKGHGTVRLSSRLRCYRRGLHELGPVTLESQVPFGLFRKRRTKQAPLPLLVYPRSYPMKRLALAGQARAPSELKKRARMGQEVIGSRYYYPGDPLKLIHWRNTARLRKLAVKEMEDTAERALTVIFDARRDTGHGRETTLEYAIKIAASLGVHAIQAGESARLLAGALQGEWAAPEPFLRQLALLEPSESADLATSIRSAPRSSPAVVIVAAADIEGVRAVAQGVTFLPGLVAVVLEGFDDADMEAGSAESLTKPESTEGHRWTA